MSIKVEEGLQIIYIQIINKTIARYNIDGTYEDTPKLIKWAQDFGIDANNEGPHHPPHLSSFETLERIGLYTFYKSTPMMFPHPQAVKALIDYHVVNQPITQ